MEKKMLHTKAEVLCKSVQKNEGIIDAVVGSTEVLDRAGDTISQSGWDLSAYKKTNPVILWGHNVKEERPPIGKALKVWVSDKGEKLSKLMFKVQFDLQDPFASEIFRKVKDGFINTVSVGFKPTEWEQLDEDNPFGGRKYLKQELLELSFVPVPANPEAVIELKGMKDKRFDPVDLKDAFPEVKEKKRKKVVEAKKVEKKKTVIDIVKEKIKKKVKIEKVEEKKVKKSLASTKPSPKKEKIIKKDIVENKSVVSYKDLGIMPESAPWDGPGEVSKADTTDLKLISTWYDSEKPDTKSSYKLPHHNADGHKAVWRGVAAAMAALLGARGGIQIPESDKRGVYNHLRKHYKQFDKDIPDFKAVEGQVLAGFDEEIHALMLDREDKYMVRLIKQIIREQKNIKRVEIKSEARGYTTKELGSALKLIDLALSHVLKGSAEGGDKTKG